MMAACVGKQSIMDALFARGLDADAEDDVSADFASTSLMCTPHYSLQMLQAQQTPLHWAAAGGQDAIVTSLLARGARVDHTCKVCFVCLSATIESKILTTLHAYLFMQNGKTALIRAATNGECESIKLLCTHGANISHQDNVSVPCEATLTIQFTNIE